MKLVPLLCASALLPLGTRLSTDYAAPRTLRVECENALELETTRFSMERDGEEVGGDFGRQTLSESTHTVVFDTPLAQADGQPSKLRRRFETVEGQVQAEFGDQSIERERESPFDGLVLVLERDDEGDVRAEVVEGSEPADSELLRHQRLTLALDAFLPPGEVELGARWPLDSETVRRGLGLDAQRTLFPPPAAEQGEEAGGSGGRRRRGAGGELGGAAFLAQAEWQGTAELTALDEEVDGQPCARIALVITAEGELPEPEWGGGRGGGRAFGLARPALENSYAIDLEGELLFALEPRCPVSAKVEGTVSLKRHTERERNGSTMVMESEREGTWSQTVTVAVEAREGDE